jgi:hypothetical protein
MDKNFDDWILLQEFVLPLILGKNIPPISRRRWENPKYVSIIQNIIHFVKLKIDKSSNLV